MADEIILKYTVDTSDLDKLGDAIQDVTSLIQDQKKVIQATYSDKSVTEATRGVSEFGNQTMQLTQKLQSLRSQIQEVTGKMQEVGKGTAGFKKLEEQAGNLNDQFKETGEAIDEIASRTKALDAISQGMKGATASAKLLGTESEALRNATGRLGEAQEILEGAFGKTAVKAKESGIVIKTVEGIAKAAGTSIEASWALASGGVTFLIAGLVNLVAYINKASAATKDYNQQVSESDKAAQKQMNTIAQLSQENNSAAGTLQKIPDTSNATNDLLANEQKKTQAYLGLMQQFNRSREELDKEFSQFTDESGTGDVEKFKKWEEDKRAAAGETFTQIAEGTKKVADTVGQIFNDIADKKLQNLQIQYGYEEAELGRWYNRAQEMAAGNSVKQAAVQRLYAAEQQQQQRNMAIEEAKIKRAQAEMDKATKIIGIITQTALNIVKNVDDPPMLATSIATGALELALVAAQPLPPIPRFEKGGAVVLAGGKKNDGHLYGRSHREGGMLINAEGGEYIWDIPTVKKHGDIIKAAHENRIEALVFHKYLLPMMQNKAVAGGQPAYRTGRWAVGHEGYDDFMLRTETKGVRQAVNNSTKQIVKAIKENRNNTYLNSRYH